MKGVVLILLAVYLSGVCYGKSEALFMRTLLKRATSKSSASASGDSPTGRSATTASATSTGGTAESVASATSQAFTKVENQLIQFFKFVDDNVRRDISKSTEDFCTDAFAVIEEQLKAAGSVSASAYAEALATVEITGTGQACSASEASAQSQAAGFAEIVVDAAAKASIAVTEARAKAAVEVVNHVIAEAFAESFASACLTDEGIARALQTSFAEAVIKPIATVAVIVAAGVDCSAVEGFSATEVTGSAEIGEDETISETTSTAESTGISTVDTKGIATAATFEVKRCFGRYFRCCVEFSDICTCTRAGSTPLCHAERVIVSGKKYWKYVDDTGEDEYCMCSSGRPFIEYIY